MTGFFFLLIGIAAALTVYALARGIFTMASGRDTTGVTSNRLMTLRIIFQAVTVLFVIIFFLLARNGFAN